MIRTWRASPHVVAAVQGHNPEGRGGLPDPSSADQANGSGAPRADRPPARADPPSVPTQLPPGLSFAGLGRAFSARFSR